MKVYISMDAEGISGIYKLAQVMPGNSEYDYARKLMACDINAAAAGAFDAGADAVFVNDAHNNGDNLRITDLDERVVLCSGADRPYTMAEGAQKRFDAALLIGYHARKGSKGVISHSYAYGSMVEMKLNGKIISEYELIGHMIGCELYSSQRYSAHDQSGSEAGARRNRNRKNSTHDRGRSCGD